MVFEILFHDLMPQVTSVACFLFGGLNEISAKLIALRNTQVANLRQRGACSWVFPYCAQVIYRLLQSFLLRNDVSYGAPCVRDGSGILFCFSQKRYSGQPDPLRSLGQCPKKNYLR
jgi:hypothetical protein